MKIFAAAAILVSTLSFGGSAFAGSAVALLVCPALQPAGGLDLYESRPFSNDPKTFFLGTDVSSGLFSYHTTGNYSFKGRTDLGDSVELLFDESGSPLTKDLFVRVKIDKSLLTPGQQGLVTATGTLTRETQTGALETIQYSGSATCVSTDKIQEVLKFQ